MRCAVWIVALVAGLSPAPAFASQASNAAFELYRAGKYEAAIAAGEAANDGEAVAVAARAAFAQANLSEMPCLPCLQRVEASRAPLVDARYGASGRLRLSGGGRGL